LKDALRTIAREIVRVVRENVTADWRVTAIEAALIVRKLWVRGGVRRFAAPLPIVSPVK